MPEEGNSSRLINGWFSEICPMWPGMALSVEIKEQLYSNRSRFQKIDVYRTRTQGNMMVLDGIIQLTEADEFAYHEMMTHVALFAHPDPRTVLVIGGGDGGVLRELGKHPCLERIDFCEIDAEVIETAGRFFPSTACGFQDPRISVHIEDGCTFIREHQDHYDVIIVDSSDPVGPGEVLFTQAFYKDLKAALKPGGIVASQGESFFMHPSYVEGLTRTARSVFSIHGYCQVLVPSYPGGNLGICLCSMETDIRRPSRPVDPEIQAGLDYYCPAIHEAGFVLPTFASRMLNRIPYGENHVNPF